MTKRDFPSGRVNEGGVPHAAYSCFVVMQVSTHTDSTSTVVDLRVAKSASVNVNPKFRSAFS